MLHLTATGHPMAALRSWLAERGVVPACELPGWAGRRVKVAGRLITAKSASVKSTTKKLPAFTPCSDQLFCRPCRLEIV